MLKLSKKVEYGLMAAQYMAGCPDEIVSAKDIAQQFDISQALVAKVLQTLVRSGIIQSYHGANGGYLLAKPAYEVSVADVIQAIEGREGALVECQDTNHEQCSVHDSCTIRQPLSVLQERIIATFATMSIQELAQPNYTVQLEVS